jgi:2-octaprenyl-6-methoxyphenol hydroxylase
MDSDILIAGGGMAGLTLALALEQAGFDVIVVDAQTPSAQLAPSYDGRCSAIAFANFRMWRALGVGEAMAAYAQPIEKILITDGEVQSGPSPLQLVFDQAELGDTAPGEALGYMIENRAIRAALIAKAQASAKLKFLAPVAVERSTPGPGGIETTLSDGRVLKSSLVVAAEGRKSRLRQQAGIRTTGWDYPVTALVCTVAHDKPHGGVAHEYFLPQGPFAILPLVGDRANVVWAEKHTVAQALLAMPEAGFLAELRVRFGDFLGGLRLAGPRFGYPLSLQIAERAIADRLALVADAWHGIHPIAGQGLNLGLKDVAALAECLQDGVMLGLEPGDPAILKRYEKWRRFDTMAMAYATDGFDKLFSNRFAPIQKARRIGLAAVNALPFARKFFITQAGGAGGVLPKLLRGVSLAA